MNTSITTVPPFVFESHKGQFKNTKQPQIYYMQNHHKEAQMFLFQGVVEDHYLTRNPLYPYQSSNMS